MPTYTHTTPYQPNGYTPIQYGTANGVIGNTFMTNNPYQDNGYAPITYGTANGPANPFFNALNYPTSINYAQKGQGPGPANPFFNTFKYQDNGYAPITYGTGIGPNNTFNNINYYWPEGKEGPDIGTAEYLDWLSEYTPLEPVFRSPNTIQLINTYPNAGENADTDSKDGLAMLYDGPDIKDVGTSAALGLVSGLTSNTAITGLIGQSGKQKNYYKLLSKEGIRTIQDSYLPYYDYRREIGKLGDDTRVDGAAALLRGSALAGVYSGASLAPGGAYSIFNLESTYGFGSTAGFNPQASKDFTLRSNVASRWKRGAPKGGFIQTINPIELATQFRGDKVNVIDFGSKTYSQIYKWKPPASLEQGAFGEFLDDLGIGTTRDFIKFYFTGPKLTANPSEGTKDDVLVFRAMISSLTDTFNASWNPVKYIGRADPNYTYQGYGRQFDVNFTVYASDRDEMKPMYRKLNYLASYTAPTYSDDSLTMQAPFLRVTIGDLLVHQPVVLTSVYYTFVDGETTWETNLLKDPTMMEVPFKVEVSIQFNVITDYLPQKGGKMYSLAKQFDANNVPKEGKDNWLSDSKGTTAPADDRNLFKKGADALKGVVGDLL
jgi:hypothetical protein